MVVNDLREGDAAGTVDALPGGASQHLAVGADVSDSAAVEAMQQAAMDRYGRLDVLVNNAGIPEGAPGEIDHLNEVAEKIMGEVAQSGHATTRWEVITSITDDSLRRMLAVHTEGTFFNIRAAIPRMRAGGGGAIVNISSGSAVVGLPGNPHYAAAKAGILALTRNAAGELGPDNIRVNAVCPGLIDTEAQRAGLTDAMRMVIAGQAPLRRLGLPEEIAAAVAFLASDDASVPDRPDLARQRRHLHVTTSAARRGARVYDVAKHVQLREATAGRVLVVVERDADGLREPADRHVRVRVAAGEADVRAGDDVPERVEQVDRSPT